MYNIQSIIWCECLNFFPFIDMELQFGGCDQVTSFMTLSAACASAGITTFLDNNLNQCATNHCGKYEGAIAMALLCWMVVSLSFYHSFWFMTMRFIHLTKSISFKLWIKWWKWYRFFSFNFYNQCFQVRMHKPIVLFCVCMCLYI